MFISEDVLDASLDAIGDIAEVGLKVNLCVVDDDAPKGSTEQELYANFYGQSQNEKPIFKNVYQIDGYVTYNPSEDALVGAGLSEKCQIVVMFATYQLFNVKFSDINGDFHTIIEQLKRVMVDYNGKLFSVKDVGMTGTLNGFSIICNLGCDVYE